MDCSTQKFYHEHNIDTRKLVDAYFSDKPEMMFKDTSLKFPMEKLHHIFSTGNTKGEILIDVSTGPLVHHLFSACEFFKDIYLLRFREQCSMELNRWLNTRTGALDWNHASSYVTALEGNSDQCEDKEMRLKTAIKQIVNCSFEKENITDPVVLPQADCIITTWLLEVTSKDENDYISHLRKITKLLKPGGHLILLGALNGTYYMVGQEKFHVFKYDENFARNVLSGEGFIIDHCDVVILKKVVRDLTDVDATLFITARKGN
ncbi:nicotinamide N-methyltransferase-like [Pseudophryne corroboree]|uniref:nicotinamide N-methyltransferase-like n=1 Tax=Pseudophryne corroboree TaxID=495146 RepID=UPI003081EF33